MASKSIEWDELLLTNDPKKKEIEVSFKKIDGDGFIVSKGNEPGTPGGQEEGPGGDQGPNDDDDGDGTVDGGSNGEGPGGGGDPIPGDNPECEPATCPDVDENGYLEVLESSPEVLYREGGPNARTPENLVLSTGPALWTPPSANFPNQPDWGYMWNRVQNAWGNQGTGGLYHLVNYSPSSSINATAIVNPYTNQGPGDPEYDWYFNVLGLGPLSPCGAAPISYGVSPLNTGINNSLGSGPWRPGQGEEGEADLQGTLQRSGESSASWVIAFHYDGVSDTTGASWGSFLCDNRTAMVLTTPILDSETVSAQTFVTCSLKGAGANAVIEVNGGGKISTVGIVEGWNFLNCSVVNTFAGGARIFSVDEQGEPTYALYFETVSNYTVGGAAGSIIISNTSLTFDGNQFWNYELDTDPRYGRYQKCGWGTIIPISSSNNFTLGRGLRNLNLVTTGPYDPNILNSNTLNDQIFPGTKQNPDYCQRIT